jgi:retron-type reverse transcriptase
MEGKDLSPDLLTRKDELIGSILDGSYRPKPARGVEIPKAKMVGFGYWGFQPWWTIWFNMRCPRF